MPDYALVRHKVRDFASWKRAYDTHLPARNAANLVEKHVLQNSDDPHEVIILFEVKDLAKARAFAKSSDLIEAMQKAGVTDEPDLLFLNG